MGFPCCDEIITRNQKVDGDGLLSHAAMVPPRPPYWVWVGGVAACLPVAAKEPRFVRKQFRLPVVALTAMTLAACTQSSAVSNKSTSVATRQQASPGLNPMAAFVTNDRRAAGSPDELYGLASFYTEGMKTASGEKLDGHTLTAAHRTLPFGTRVRVTNVTNGRSVTVRINDRGPFVPGRIVDVSYFAAETLGMTGTGVAKVQLEIVP